MSTIIKILIHAEDVIHMEEILERMNDALIKYSKKHLDFSYKINTNFDKLEIEVSSMHLKEEMN